ncbi:thioesterase [Pseudenhygromyxa sp. WMMC2535]|nr:thioesterase [Pseudenhygromyxa sp. WMMC2535]
MFVSWVRELRHHLDVVPIQLPGRDGRKHEALTQNLDELVDEIARAMQPRLARPYAVFGHSMGSLLAFEVCRRLQELGAPPPVQLFVSGRRAPQAVVNPVTEGLDDASFVHMIQSRFGGIPDQLMRDEELLKFFVPTLRADFQLLNAYSYRPGPRLSCPVHAFGGREDRCVTPEELRAWGEQTRGEFSVQSFPGGHFYLHDEQPALLRTIVRRITL